MSIAWNIFRISLLDLAYERSTTVCLSFAVATILAPLLVLFGLKTGLIDTIFGKMLNEPVYRQLHPIGSGRYDADWFDKMQQDSRVGFVIAKTRSIAASIILRNKNTVDSTPVRAALIPTNDLDPLLSKIVPVPAELTDILLSESAAKRLIVKSGANIQGIVTRTLNGRRERKTISLSVVGVIPEWKFDQDGIFSQLALLTAVEDYRDGYSVPALGWGGRQKSDTTRTYASFRLYASSIFDVASLSNYLRSNGIEVGSRTSEIRTMTRLKDDLSLIFWLIASMASVGYLLSLGAYLWANVDRKKRDMQILGLLGVNKKALIVFPIGQSVSTALIGIIVGTSMAFLASSFLNFLFSGSNNENSLVCEMQFQHVIVGAGVTFLFSIIASFQASRVIVKDTEINVSEIL